MSDTNERSVASDGSVAGEPMAWAVMQPDSYSVFVSKLLAEKRQELCMGGDIIPLHRQPQPTLTDAEREAVRFCVTASLPETEKLGGVAGELCRMHAARLRGLLERLK